MSFKFKIKYILNFNSILILILIFSGCKKNNQPKEDSIVKAYRLIDQQRTNEAIDLLESDLKTDPNNNEMKFVLASAYAHKAGIKIQKLVPIITQLEKFRGFKNKKANVKKEFDYNQLDQNKKNIVNKENSISSSTQINSSGEKQINKLAITASNFFGRMSSILETYAAIPSVSTYQVEFIKHAISLINSIGTQVNQEQALYRALLEVILFKYLMDEIVTDETIDTSIIENQRCIINQDKLNESITLLGNLVIDINKDMALANPKHAEHLVKMNKDINQQITQFPTSLNSMDNASASIMKRMAIENGLGKLIKCTEI